MNGANDSHRAMCWNCLSDGGSAMGMLSANLGATAGDVLRYLTFVCHCKFELLNVTGQRHYLYVLLDLVG